MNEKLKTWFIERLKERSTWVGLSALISVFGYNIGPDQIGTALSLGLAVFGTGLVVTKDNKLGD